MSWDYTVYVKTTRSTMKDVIAAATRCAPEKGGRVEPIEEDDGTAADDEIIVAPCGAILVAMHRFGVELSISSATGANADLGEIVDKMATTLGEALPEEEAQELIAREEAEGWKPPVTKVKTSKKKAAAAAAKPVVGGAVLVTLIDHTGKTVSEVETTAALMRRQQLPGGMLKSSATGRVPAILTDEGRYPFKAKRLVCTLYDGPIAEGRVRKRVSYELDGYGRLTSVEDEKIVSS